MTSVTHLTSGEQNWLVRWSSSP